MTERARRGWIASVVILLGCASPSAEPEVTQAQPPEHEAASPPAPRPVPVPAPTPRPSPVVDPLPEPEPEPQPTSDVQPAAEPEIAPIPAARAHNRAKALVKRAKKIERIEIVSPDQSVSYGDLDGATLVAFRSNVSRSGAIVGEWTASPRQWDVVVLIHVKGRKDPFVAHAVGFSRIRLNPFYPWSPRNADDEGVPDLAVQEIEIGEDVVDAIGSLLDGRVELNKEYRSVRDWAKRRAAHP